MAAGYYDKAVKKAWEAEDKIKQGKCKGASMDINRALVYIGYAGGHNEGAMRQGLAPDSTDEVHLVIKAFQRSCLVKKSKRR